MSRDNCQLCHATSHTARWLRSVFPDYHAELHEILVDGDLVVARLMVSGTHRGDFMGIPPTGDRVTMEAIHIYRFSEGKLAEHWVARDDLGMMRQLGVVPAPGQSEEAGPT